MKKIIVVAASLMFTATSAFARDNIQIAGSSTVLPYASIVAEAFGDNTDFPTPVVESGGSSSGLKRFCKGVGMNTIDIANASRQIREKEIKACAENGVSNIIEVRIGYDGIVFASDIEGYKFEFTPKDIYLAINSSSDYQTWNQVNPEFSNQKIQMFIPGTKHGTREVFEEKVLLEGCEEVHGPAESDEQEQQCISIRTDGVSVDIDGDYTETLSRIDTNKDAIGVFGLSFYENNTDKLQVATMNGIQPNSATISSGEYPVSRPLFFYVKQDHIGVVPGLLEYTQFFVADEIAGPNGPLSTYGLVSDPELRSTQQMISVLE